MPSLERCLLELLSRAVDVLAHRTGEVENLVEGDAALIPDEEWDALSDESKLSFMQAFVDFDPSTDVIEGWGNEADEVNNEWRLARTWIVCN